MEKNLSEIGRDKIWLSEELQKQGVTKMDNIFLATYKSDGTVCVYMTNKNL